MTKKRRHKKDKMLNKKKEWVRKKFQGYYKKEKGILAGEFFIC